MGHYFLDVQCIGISLEISKTRFYGQLQFVTRQQKMTLKKGYSGLTFIFKHLRVCKYMINFLHAHAHN